MLQGPSTAEQVRAWVQSHAPVDLAIEVVVLAALATVCLMFFAGVLYWIWWLRRLAGDRNVSEFIDRPFPELWKVKGFGQELELARQGLPQVGRATQAALEALHREQGVLKEGLAKLEKLLDNWEDFQGKLPQTGGGRDAGK